MKRSSSFTASKAKSSQKNVDEKNRGEKLVVIDWEVRPGGLLVQKRGVTGPASGGGGPMIRIKVSHYSDHHNFSVPSESTFGNLKRVIANKIGLEPRVQRLLFRGKEKDDDECLHIAGVQDMSKVILLEDPKSEETRKNQPDSNDAYEAVASVRAEVDKLSVEVLQMEKAVQNGAKIVDKEVLVLTELLMMQLFKLDSIEANGKPREQRRAEVHRVQSLVEKLDKMKAMALPIPMVELANGRVSSQEWEASLPPTSSDHSTQVFKHWEGSIRLNE